MSSSISAISRGLPRVALAALAALAAGCGGEAGITVVTVAARPAVGAVAQLEVSLDNASASQRETFTVTGREFPLSFSVSTAGRSGPMTVRVEASNGNGEVRAAGAVTVELDPAGRVEAALTLAPNDFVVNSTYVGTQDLAFRSDAGGRQLSAGLDGHFTIGWSDTCQMVGRCDVFGRRYDATGTPLATAIAAGTAQFNFNQTSGLIGYEPSLATDRSGNTLAAWATAGELFAVVVDATGAALTSSETTVTTATTPGTPAVIALPDGRFVVAWGDASATAGQRVIKARYLSSSGVPINNPVTGTTAAFQVSSTVMTNAAVPAMVSLGTGGLVIAWTDVATVRGRFYGPTGTPISGSDLVMSGHPLTDDIGPPQLAALAGNPLLLFRRATTGGDADNGQLVLRRMSASGALIGTDVVVNDDVERGPAGLSTTSAGEVAVVWSACTTATDGSGCGVWFRQYSGELAPRTDAIAVNTTTEGDQEDPSVGWLPDGAAAVAWSDDSMAEPDLDGGAVRARIIYPTAP